MESVQKNENPNAVAVEENSEIEIDEDDKILKDFGYKAQLYRGFNGFMSFTFCFTAVSVLSSMSLLFSYGLSTGGPVVMVWGWIIASIFTNIIGLSMAEICSSYPTAGSVYHWAGMLAPPGYTPHFSYICGWFNLLGNAAGDASFAFGFAQFLDAAIQVNTRSEKSLSTGGLVGVSIAIAFSWAVKNLARVDKQGWLNNISGIYQLVSTAVIIIVILSVNPKKASSEFVWTTFNNDTGMTGKNDGVYICLIGLLMSLFTFSGYEGCAHMAEETAKSTSAAPKGIVYTCICTALTGFAYLLGLLYASQGNIEMVQNGNSSQPIINDFYLAFNNTQGEVNVQGVLGLNILLIINIFFAGFSSLTVTSRIAFAMARDNALPFSGCLKYVHKGTQTPVGSILLVFILDALICLLPLFSSTAFAAITSITTIGYQISYAIPIFLRCTFFRHKFVQSDFNLGRLSVPLGHISWIWLTITSTFFIFPTSFNEHNKQDSSIFNYTCVVVGGTLIISGVYWFFPKYGARYHFQGPKKGANDIVNKNDLKMTEEKNELKDNELKSINEQNDNQLNSAGRLNAKENDDKDDVDKIKSQESKQV